MPESNILNKKINTFPDKVQIRIVTTLVWIQTVWVQKEEQTPIL